MTQEMLDFILSNSNLKEEIDKLLNSELDSTKLLRLNFVYLYLDYVLKSQESLNDEWKKILSKIIIKHNSKNRRRVQLFGRYHNNRRNR